MLIPFDRLFAQHGIQTKGVLHLGANTGQEAEVYDALGIQKVVWVEALPDIHAKLQAHILPFPGQIALCACVSSVEGDIVTFRRANNEAQSSSFLEFGTHAKEHPTTKFIGQQAMRTQRVDALLQRASIKVEDGWFLNVDLQGAELLALVGMGELLRKFAHAYIEVNKAYLYKGCPLVEQIDDYLAKYGFVGVETLWTKHGWGDKYYQRKN